MTRRIPRRFVTLAVTYFSHRWISCCLVGGIVWIIFALSYTAASRDNSTLFRIQLVRNLPPEAEEKARSLLSGKPILTPHLKQTQSFLVILVLTAPGNFENRKAIRETWADQSSPLRNQNATFQTVFLIGQSNITANIRQEHDLHSDILLGSFEDSYKRLVSKVHLGINWALNSITQFEYLIKCDDDVYVNIPRIIKWLQSSHALLPRNFYGGYIHHEVKPVREHYKNALSRMDYPGKLFPPYAAGPAYMLSRSALKLVVNASHFVKPFFVEDAFMGCLAYHSGINAMFVEGFRLDFSSHYVVPGACDLFGVYVVGHNLNTSSLAKLHSKISAFESLDINVANSLCIQEQHVAVCKVLYIITVVAITGLMVYLFYIYSRQAHCKKICGLLVRTRVW